jgi:hypothetical protein
MKIKKTIIFAALLIASIGIAWATVLDMSGKWTGALRSPDGNTSQVDYTFKTDGNKLTGTAESVFGTAAIENGKITGKGFTFDIFLNGLDFPHKGVLSADSIALDIDYKGQPLHVILKRSVK